jgi:hypothetical protein
MEYREIVAVTGLSGLYQLLATKSDGAIVRSLDDKSTKFISARVHNVTPLESIEIYTTGDNVRLHDVLKKMQDMESTNALPAGKAADNNAVKSYFKAVFPEFDEDRVYVSDMKKMLKWYEILKANDLLHFEKQLAEAAEAEKANSEEPEAVVAEITETAEEKKPAKKARAKKEAAPVAAQAEGEEAPAKKTARKKKTEE